MLADIIVGIKTLTSYVSSLVTRRNHKLSLAKVRITTDQDILNYRSGQR